MKILDSEKSDFLKIGQEIESRKNSVSNKMSSAPDDRSSINQIPSLDKSEDKIIEPHKSKEVNLNTSKDEAPKKKSIRFAFPN